MQIPVHFTRPQIATEPPALVRVISREDVMWHHPERPIFQAPPLNVRPPLEDVAASALQIHPATASATSTTAGRSILID